MMEKDLSIEVGDYTGITFQTLAFELLELKLDGESEKLEYKLGKERVR